jgi:nitroreductase
MQAIDALLGRRSARTLGEPAPDARALELMLRCALRAPDHGRLRPWRFIVIRDEGRERFGELLASHLLRARPDASAAALDKERAKARRAPVIIVVAAAVAAGGKIPRIEQLLSSGAAAHGILLAARALGFNAVWKTGGAAYDDAVKTALGLAADDVIVAFLYVGSEPDAAESRADALSPGGDPELTGFVRAWP